MSAKITLATVKKFIRENIDELNIQVKSRFNGMTDGVESVKSFFKPVVVSSKDYPNSMAIEGAWFVYESRDRFSAFEEGGFKGIKVSNACGSFVLAVPIPGYDSSIFLQVDEEENISLPDFIAINNTEDEEVVTEDDIYFLKTCRIGERTFIGICEVKRVA